MFRCGQNLKPLLPQFLIGRHIAVVNQNVCCLRCLLWHASYHSFLMHCGKILHMVIDVQLLLLDIYYMKFVYLS